MLFKKGNKYVKGRPKKSKSLGGKNLVIYLLGLTTIIV